MLEGNDQLVRRQGDGKAHRGHWTLLRESQGFFAPVPHEDAVCGPLADRMDPAPEPLTGVGLELDLQSDELVGQ